MALPQVESTSKQILKTIADVKDHPGKKWSLGAYSKLPTVPGTEQANFRVALGQLQGQTFLQAYQTLRGGGAITDIEGAKGTAALNAMNTAQTEEAFNKAADDFARYWSSRAAWSVRRQKPARLREGQALRLNRHQRKMPSSRNTGLD